MLTLLVSWKSDIVAEVQVLGTVVSCGSQQESTRPSGTLYIGYAPDRAKTCRRSLRYDRRHTVLAESIKPLSDSVAFAMRGIVR